MKKILETYIKNLIYEFSLTNDISLNYCDYHDNYIYIYDYTYIYILNYIYWNYSKRENPKLLIILGDYF